MDFNEYQKFAKSTALYPNKGNNLWYPGLGLGGESGEVQECIKKIYRDEGGVVSCDARTAICMELGDVLWYVAAVATELGVPLETIVKANVAKLSGRVERGTVHGSGDNR